MKNELHMRIHAISAVIVAILAVALKLQPGDCLWLLSAVVAVWVTELLNTAIERTVDLASPGESELAKIAKDTAAGAVLVASVYAVAVGIVVLGPPLWEKLAG
ncbi:diacylglycerol kinase family protein [Cohnella fermenti]|uniref:Diacylglycerol kinase family protein n=2 Tax=Cohnella fermenti TaxID=2565925 RepID=A0A4S4BKS6_9BACL|nr:diacylglycerol kinase family protein [Cohnella fermenti]